MGKFGQTEQEIQHREPGVANEVVQESGVSEDKLKKKL